MYRELAFFQWATPCILALNLSLLGYWLILTALSRCCFAMQQSQCQKKSDQLCRDKGGPYAKLHPLSIVSFLGRPNSVFQKAYFPSRFGWVGMMIIDVAYGSNIGPNALDWAWHQRFNLIVMNFMNPELVPPGLLWASSPARCALGRFFFVEHGVKITRWTKVFTVFTSPWDPWLERLKCHSPDMNPSENPSFLP